MALWWEGLSSLSRFFYLFAIPSTVVLLLQSVLTLIGFGMGSDGDMDFGDGDADVELDFDGDIDIEPDGIDFDLDSDGINEFQNLAGADFRFVTFRGIIAFATMFGWIGAALAGTSLHLALTMILAILAGLGGMLIIALLFYGISKLQQSGNINYRLAIGKDANVYIPIPANKKGHGKVQLLLQERFIEANAVTNDSTMIGTNELVRVVDLLDATTFVVERLK